MTNSPIQLKSSALDEERIPELVTDILRLALSECASDVHLDPTPEGVRLRLRCDGALRTVQTLPANLGARLVGRCKSIADLLVYRQDLPQEGRIPSDRSGIDSDVRVATYPTVEGERVALRLSATTKDRPLRVDQLGLEPEVAAALSAAISQPDGVVLLTGPSGSGKTTTLYACLQHIAGASGNERTIFTVEDPVERRLDGVVQTEVHPAAGLDFARALRSILRQDPEVILVGEVRDRETAAIALEAGLTGHLVASTVHAGTAPEVFTRLLEMGVEPFVLTTTVRGVLAQRLLRRKCAVVPCVGAGCAACGGTGYDGRVLVAEWLPMSEGLRKAILARADGQAIAATALVSGAEPLRAVAMRMVERGVTDLAEVERVLGEPRADSAEAKDVLIAASSTEAAAPTVRDFVGRPSEVASND